MRPRVESPGALTSTSTYVRSAVQCSGYCIAVKIPPKKKPNYVKQRNLTWAGAGAGAQALALALRRMTPDDSGIKIKPHDIRRQEATRACANAKPRAGAQAAAGQEAG